MSKIEVYLSENQVSSLKSMLNQSERGFHVLFDNDLIAEVFKKETTEEDFFDMENIKKIQDDLLSLLRFSTLHEKKGFISSLTHEARHRLVRAYFYIIENNLKSNQRLPH